MKQNNNACSLVLFIFALQFYDLSQPSLAEGGGKDEKDMSDMLSKAKKKYGSQAANYADMYDSQPTLQTLMLLAPDLSDATAQSLAQAAAKRGDGFVPAKSVVNTWYGTRLESKKKRWSYTIPGELCAILFRLLTGHVPFAVRQLAMASSCLINHYYFRSRVAGLYDNFRPRGVGFFGDIGDVPKWIMVCMQADEPLLLGNNTPSALVFFKRAESEPYKVLQLYIDDKTPFTGTCGGVTQASKFVYVTDDTNQEGWVYGFLKGDIDSQLGKGRQPGRLTVAKLDGRLLAVNLAVTASHIYYDDDLRNPRLWVRAATVITWLHTFCVVVVVEGLAITT